MSNTKNLILSSAILLSFSLFTGCMKTKNSLEQSSQKAAESIGCVDMKSQIFDSLYDYVEQEKSEPQTADLKLNLRQAIDEIAHKQNIHDRQQIENLKFEFDQLLDILLTENLTLKTPQSAKQIIQSLIELEMQDTTTARSVQLNQKLDKQFQKVTTLSSDLKIKCSNSATAAEPAPNREVKSTQQRMIAGVNNVFSTAYQSCQALSVKPLTESIPDVVGIEKVGVHEDGIGGVRIVSNLSAVQQTHPYIRVASSGQSSCYNVKNNPLIYDYGGAPSVANNTINFFKNAGSGSNVLGIDCSAYVSSAIAAAGLRYKPGLENKAIYVRQSSEKFIDAKASGFSCFNNVVVTKAQSLQPGDICGVRGHVVMIDQMGSDPFGLKKLTSIADCEKLNPNNFDFTISQSSPEKNGLGINKYVIRDYLKAKAFSGKMNDLFMGAAKAACLAYFKNTSTTLKTANWGVLRHNGKSECLASQITMTSQSCVQSCRK